MVMLLHHSRILTRIRFTPLPGLRERNKRQAAGPQVRRSGMFGAAWRSRFSGAGQRQRVPLGVSITMLGYFKRCRHRPSLALRDRSRWICSLSTAQSMAQAGPAQGLDRASALPCQGRAQGQMHQHHHAHHRVKTSAPTTLPSSAPQYSLKRALTRSTAVLPLYNRSNCLVMRRMRREPPQVQFALDPRHQAVAPLPVAPQKSLGHDQPSCAPDSGTSACHASLHGRP